MPDALSLLAARRSVAPAFLSAPGPDAAQIETLLTLASRVPDHGKLAPWRFIVYQGTAREKLGERLAALLLRRDPGTAPERLAEERTRFTRAPLVIAVVSRAAAHVKIPLWEQQLSAGASAMTLLIAAHAMGFAGAWLTDWVAYDAEARALAGLHPDERIAGFVHIGTPTIVPIDRERPALSAIVSVGEE